MKRLSEAVCGSADTGRWTRRDYSTGRGQWRTYIGTCDDTTRRVRACLLWGGPYAVLWHKGRYSFLGFPLLFLELYTCNNLVCLYAKIIAEKGDVTPRGRIRFLALRQSIDYSASRFFRMGILNIFSAKSIIVELAKHRNSDSERAFLRRLISAS